MREEKKIMCDILYCGVSAVIYNAELNKTFSKIRLCFEYQTLIFIQLNHIQHEYMCTEELRDPIGV